MTVISLAQVRAERTPQWEGPCICLGCRHAWTGIGTIGATTGLECPSCSLPKGVVKHPFGAKPGDAEFRCNCGCEAMTVYRRSPDGYFVTRCMACGEGQTAAIYGETP